jgi:hypothetical protein
MKPIFFIRSTVKSKNFLYITIIIGSILFQIIFRHPINLQMNIGAKVGKPEFEIINILILLFEHKTEILFTLKIQKELIILFALYNVFEILNRNLLFKYRLINQINEVGRQNNLSALIDSPPRYFLTCLHQKNFFVKLVVLGDYPKDHTVGDHLLVISVHFFIFNSTNTY